MTAATVKTQAELNKAIADKIETRILSKVVVDGSTGCWIWQGSNDGRYGRIWLQGHLTMAHRASLAVATGKLPDDMDADHLCRTTLCVNPDHLEWVTHAENVDRTWRDTCKNGHLRTDENTLIDPRGYRRCRECNRLGLRRRRACVEVDINGKPVTA